MRNCSKDKKGGEAGHFADAKKGNGRLSLSDKCPCVASSSEVRAVDHLQKRNCQDCGAFIINSEDQFQAPSQPTKVI